MGGRSVDVSGRGVRVNGRSVGAGSAIPDSGISRWTFDDADTDLGTAIDVWGSNDGTINGATTGVSGANQTYTTNEAYSFDGSDDYVRVSDNSSLDSVRSVFTWVYGQNLSSDIFSETVYNDSTSGGGGDQVRLIRLGADGGSVFVTDSSGTAANATFGQSFNDDQWYHLGFTYETDGTITSYIDGSSVNSDSSANGDFLAVDQGAAIGSRVTDTLDFDRYFSGDIDDVRLYDKALSSTEVSNLYNTGRIDG